MNKALSKLLYSFLAIIVLLVQFPGIAGAAASNTDTVLVSKSVDPAKLLSGGEAEVKLAVQGSGDTNFVKPNDIILIIDRSGSMAPSYGPNNGEDKMSNAKNAAKGFIDLVDFSKHRVGVVDFASNTSYKDLSADPTEIKQYIDGIRANGGTGTRNAIALAKQLLSNHRADAQPVIILMTDGQATEPSPDSYARQVALEEAALAKSEGIVFYTIALLLQNESPDSSAPNLLMKEMATTAHHHHFVLGSVGLAEIYEAIVDEIGIASAYDVVIKDILAPEFELVPGSYEHNIPQPTVSGNTLLWSFNELKKETLTLSYKIRHKADARVGKLSVGAQDINVKYKDYSGVPHEYNTTHPIVTVSYPAPVISSVVEDNGDIKGGETVIINGQFFRNRAQVLFGTTPAEGINFIDSTKLEVTVPSGSQGSVEIKVTNDDGQFATATYRYFAKPVIASITPDYGPLAGGNEVRIAGNYFLPGAQVKFGETAATVVSVASKLIVVKAPLSSVAGPVDVTILNPDETQVTANHGYTYVLGPDLVTLTPNKGYTLGGETVTLQGDRFIEGAKVYFNSVLVPATFVSNNALSIVTPPWGTNEIIKVKVVNPDGQFTILDEGYSYIYPQPIITSLEPTEGLVSGGTVVKVKGIHFLNGVRVYLDDKQVSAVSYISGNEIQFRTPVWTKGETVDLKIINPDNQEVSLVDAFTYLLPEAATLSAISPIEGPLSGGTIVNITGTNFLNGTKLYFNDKEVPVSSLSATQIVAKTPAWLVAEKVDIKIIDPYGREARLDGAFQYIAPPPPPGPSVLSVTPNSGPMAGGNIVSVKGTEFVNGLKLFFNDTQVTTFSYMGKELINIKMPSWPTSGLITIKVVNPDGQESLLEGAYTYVAPPPPEITSLSPSKGLITGGTTVTLEGANFINGAKVRIGTKDVATTFNNSTQLVFKTVAWSEPETVDISVTNPDGQTATLEQAFTFETPPPPPAPTITSVSPDSGPQAGGTLVTIKGSNFVQGATIQLGQREVAATFMNSSELMIRTPAWSTGEVVDVAVINPDKQKAVLEKSFTFIAPPPKPAPLVTSVSPHSGETTGGKIISIKGENFDSSATVYFNDTLIPSTFYSTTELQLRTPKWSVAGEVNVKVVNSDGQFSTLENGFTYVLPPPPPAPVVDSAAPNSVVTTTPTNIMINGKNFVNGAKVKLGDIELTATFYSATQLAVRTPVWTQPGIVDITVINPDGQSGILTDGLNVVLPPPPTITSITPNSAQNTGGTVINIIGTSFTPSSKVYFNQVEIASTYYSTTELRVRVPASAIVGSVDVRVANADGQSVILNGGFTYTAPPMKPAPTITETSPNNGSKNGGNIISIIGANFDSGVKVYINGVLTASSFFSSTNIQVRVPASSITGSVEVKVVNSDGQSGVLVNGYTYN